MMTIIKIAWRNVWRNRLRSLVVFSSVVLGIWAGLFVVSLSMGMMDQQKRGIIETQTSHLKIHTRLFLEEEKINHFIEPEIVSDISEMLSADQRIASISTRAIIEGTFSTAHGFMNGRIVAVHPEQEKKVTTIHERMYAGTYFSEIESRPVIVGRSLADELKLDPGKTVNISFQDGTGNFPQLGFKTEGIYATSNASYDKMHLFIRSEDLTLAGIDANVVHEISIVCNDIKDASNLCNEINGKYPDLQARAWNELSPELAYTDEMMAVSIFIILLIIILALTFGIINTMLMAVLERKRELGMLLCVGMNKKKVFAMIMFETLFLSVAASPVGLILAWATITYFGAYGINLGTVEEAMYKFGVDSMVYTKLEFFVYVMITVMIIFAALFSSILPARKALKYNPAEAVRAI